MTDEGIDPSEAIEELTRDPSETKDCSLFLRVNTNFATVVKEITDDMFPLSKTKVEDVEAVTVLKNNRITIDTLEGFVKEVRTRLVEEHYNRAVHLEEAGAEDERTKEERIEVATGRSESTKVFIGSTPDKSITNGSVTSMYIPTLMSGNPEAIRDIISEHKHNMDAVSIQVGEGITKVNGLSNISGELIEVARDIENAGINNNPITIQCLAFRD